MLRGGRKRWITARGLPHRTDVWSWEGAVVRGHPEEASDPHEPRMGRSEATAHGAVTSDEHAHPDPVSQWEMCGAGRGSWALPDTAVFALLRLYIR